MKFKNMLSLLTMCSCALFSNEALFTKNRLCQFIDTLELQFSTGYAPMEWKKKSLGLDFYKEAQLAKDKVRGMSHLTLKNYQQILRDLLFSTQDYHVSFAFASTEFAFLPLEIEGAQGRYFVIDHDLSGVNKGDELLKVNNVPINEVIEGVKAQLVKSNPQTDEAYAQLFFPFRIGGLGMDVPQGKVKLEFSDAATGKKKMVSTEWIYFDEEILAPPYKIKGLAVEETDRTKVKSKARFKHSLFHPLKLEGYTALHKHSYRKRATSGINDIGGYSSFLPRLGPVVWSPSSNNPFDAYIYKNAQGRSIGYVRISSFAPEECYEDVQAFKNIIKKMQSDTEALVVDVMNNPGGYDEYMYALISTLITNPIQPPKEQITITQEDVLEALEMEGDIEFALIFPHLTEEYLQELSGRCGFDFTEENLEVLLNYISFVVSEWNKGHILTGLVHGPFIETIYPNKKVKYTKPLYVLVNELSVSCGDFFPATLQDAGRATIIGSRTAGAGGYLGFLQIDNVYGLTDIVYTKSVAERKNKTKIENTGVIPDVLYQRTVEELKNNHSGFVELINTTIEKDLMTQ